MPFFDEVAQTAKEFAGTQAAFRDTQPLSQVALLYYYDSQWAIDFQKHNEKFDDIGAAASATTAPLRKYGAVGGCGVAPTLRSKATSWWSRPA